MKSRPFVYITDDNYVIPTVVSIHSLRKFHSDEKIIVVSQALSKANEELLELFSKKNNLHIIKFDKDLAYLASKHQYVSSSSLAKFYLPEILTEDSCIYLDADTLITGELDHLLNLCLGSISIAALPDDKAMELGHNKKIGVKEYFNSGVMVMNLQKMRQNNSNTQLLKAKKNIKGYYQDQDALNFVFQNSWIPIEKKFNYFSKEIRPKEQWINSSDVKNICILHLTDKQKPWVFSDIPSSKLYEKYLSEIDILQEKVTRREYYKISVIIPVYNVSPYIEECLESLVRQSYKNIQIILVDDGSTDDSIDKAQRFKPLFKEFSVISQKNKGLSAARNAGLDEARGEFIFFLDSDDKISPLTLEHLFENLHIYNSDVSVCSFQYFSEEQDWESHVDLNWPFKFEKPDGKYNIPLDISSDICCVAWNKLYRKTVIDKYQIRFPEGVIHEDITWLWKYFSKIQNYSFLNERLYYYRQRNNSITFKKQGRYFQGYLAAYEHILKDQNLVQSQKQLLLAKLTADFKTSLRRSPVKYKISSVIDYLSILKRYFGKKIIVRKGLSLGRRKGSQFLSGLATKVKIKRENISEEKLVLNELRDLNFKVNNLQKELYTLRSVTQSFHTLLKSESNYLVRENSILVIESQDCHGECLPSVIHTLHSRGFNVDVWLASKEYLLRPIETFKDIRVFEVKREHLSNLIALPSVLRYKFIFINTEWDYYSRRTVDEAFFSNYLEKNKLIFLSHRPEFSFSKLNSVSKRLTLGEMNDYSSEVFYCCYFGVIKPHKINTKEITFVVVGNIEKKRKDFDLLLECVNFLSKSSPELRFTVKVIARVGMLKIPSHLSKYFNFLGCLDYPSMYKIIEESDFLLPLFNSHITEHLRYIHNGVSGTVNISLGFCKPMIIEEKFAISYGFDNTSSILYKDSLDFIDAFKSALFCKPEEYQLFFKNIRKKQIAKLNRNQFVIRQLVDEEGVL